MSAIRGIKIDLNYFAQSGGRKFDGCSAGVLDKSSVKALKIPNTALVTHPHACRKSHNEGRFSGGRLSRAVDRKTIEASPHATAAGHDVQVGHRAIERFRLNGDVAWKSGRRGLGGQVEYATVEGEPQFSLQHRQKSIDSSEEGKRTADADRRHAHPPVEGVKTRAGREGGDLSS